MRAAVVVVLLLASPAAAGICLSDEERDEYVTTVEKIAANPRAPGASEYWLFCVEGLPEYRTRVVKACTKILARTDLKKDFGVGADCARALAAYGVNPLRTKTGDVDYIGNLLAKLPAMHDDPTTAFKTLELSGDPRALPKVIEVFRGYLAKATTKPPRGWRADNWWRWQHGVLSWLERKGTTSDLAFLDEMETTAKEKRVRTRITAARTTITKRSASVR